MKKFIEIGNASKDCPYCYSEGEFVVCTENPKCKMTKQNEGEQPNLSSLIKNLYDVSDIDGGDMLITDHYPDRFPHR